MYDRFGIVVISPPRINSQHLLFLPPLSFTSACWFSLNGLAFVVSFKHFGSSMARLLFHIALFLWYIVGHVGACFLISFASPGRMSKERGYNQVTEGNCTGEWYMADWNGCIFLSSSHGITEFLIVGLTCFNNACVHRGLVNEVSQPAFPTCDDHDAEFLLVLIAQSYRALAIMTILTKTPPNRTLVIAVIFPLRYEARLIV